LNFFSLFKRNLFYRYSKKINIDLDTLKENSLDKLFSHYETDKANFINSLNESGHGFSKFYETHLSLFKEKKIKILEIGSYSGAAAAAFVKYFPNSEVYCLDVNLRNFKYTSKKIHAFGLDVSNHKMMLKFLSKINFFESIKHFDIIIDDGSHIQSDQLIALNFFYKHVANNGFYIIEDYKYPNYFKHLSDVDDIKIDELIKNISDKKLINSKLISTHTINDLLKNNKNTFEYKGNKEHSDIVFFEKKIIS
jgi:precorrin-6B methylase 2